MASFNTDARFKSSVPFVEGRLPARYLNAEFSRFVKFLKAYRKWQDSPGNVKDAIYSLDAIADVSRGGNTDEYFNRFREETMVLFDGDLTARRKIVLENIIDHYRSKGTEAALRFLFRILYGEEISITYPSNKFFRSPPLEINSIRQIKFIPDDQTPAFKYNATRIFGDTTQSAVSIVNTKIETFNNVDYYVSEVDQVFGEFDQYETFSGINSDGETVTGTIVPVAGNYSINAGGSDYRSDTPIDTLTPGSGTGFLSTVGGVLGGIGEIIVDDAGFGYDQSNPPDVDIVGDGVGAEATAVVSPTGTISAVNVTVPGTGYTYARVRISIDDPEETVSRLAECRAIISGEITSINFINTGVDYTISPNGAPTIDVASISPGSGASVDILPTTIARIYKAIPTFFDSDFSRTVPQNYNVLLYLGSGAGNFTIGELVRQEDQFGNLLFEGSVRKWDQFEKQLILDKTDMTLFNKEHAIVGQTSGSSYLFGQTYSSFILIDAGDGEVMREYTYYINAPISTNVFSEQVKLNAHVAGLNFFGIIRLENDFETDIDGGVQFVGAVDVDEQYIITPTNEHIISFNQAFDDQLISTFDLDRIDANREDSTTNVTIAEDLLYTITDGGDPVLVLDPTPVPTINPDPQPDPEQEPDPDQEPQTPPPDPGEPPPVGGEEIDDGVRITHTDDARVAENTDPEDQRNIHNFIVNQEFTAVDESGTRLSTEDGDDIATSITESDGGQAPVGVDDTPSEEIIIDPEGDDGNDEDGNAIDDEDGNPVETE